MAEKYEGQMVLSGLFVNGMSTAGSRKGFPTVIDGLLLLTSLMGRSSFLGVLAPV
jgi:hypothetical protein